MPTRPTNFPTWATGATGIAATVEPNGTEKANGWAVAQRPPAQYFNWFWNRVGQWLNYAHESRQALIPITSWMPQLGTDGGAAPDWASYRGVGGGATVVTAWGSEADAGRLIISLGSIVEYGAPITRIDVIVKPGQARAGGNKMKLELWEEQPDFVTPAISTKINPSGNAGIPTVSDDGTTNVQLLSMIAGSTANFANIKVDLTKDLILGVSAGNNGLTFSDSVLAARITWGG